MASLRIGIIGSGFMGRTHAEAFSKYVTGGEPVAVTGGTRAAELANDYGMALDSDLPALLAREDIDAVVICTPQHVHADQAIAAAQAGKHILLEKPMAVSVQQCRDINAACRAANVKVMLAFTQRYRRGNIEAKKIIDAGDIGEIKLMRETMVAVNGRELFPPWQQNRENLGTLLGYGVHSIDRVRWFSGSEVRRVAAHTICPPGLPAEYSAAVLMELEHGISVSLLCEMNCPAPGFPASGFHSWIIGSKGIIDLDAYGAVKLGLGSKWETVFVQAPIDWAKEGKFSPARMQSFADQDQEFVNAIRENRAPAITGEDGENAVAVALAAYEASRSHETIEIC